MVYHHTVLEHALKQDNQDDKDNGGCWSFMSILHFFNLHEDRLMLLYHVWVTRLMWVRTIEGEGVAASLEEKWCLEI